MAVGTFAVIYFSSKKTSRRRQRKSCLASWLKLPVDQNKKVCIVFFTGFFNGLYRLIVVL